ncbi:UNVERIFIED_CONTAM: hypothetical protein HDU68_000975 [Siphonaria sp. JEL0065]|nr:hypothetical protein HDU68_000975 [Siphonaria sp. JEL0065]
MLSDASLKELDLQGVSIPSNDVLVEAIAGCPSIQTLNLSGHTEITNDTITSIGSTCRLLQKLLLFGCNNVTEDCLQPLNQACPLLHYIYADEIFNANSQKTWSQRSWSVLLVPDYSNGDNWDKRAALQGTWLHGAPLARLLIQWVKNMQDGVTRILDSEPLSSMYTDAGSEIPGATYPRPLIAKSSDYGFQFKRQRAVALNQPVCLVIGHSNTAIFKYAFLVRTNTNDANPEEVEGLVSISGSNFKVCNADEFVMESYQEVEGASELVNEGICKFRDACRVEIGALFMECPNLQVFENKADVERLIAYRSRGEVEVQKDFVTKWDLQELDDALLDSIASCPSIQTVDLSSEITNNTITS